MKEGVWEKDELTSRRGEPLWRRFWTREDSALDARMAFFTPHSELSSPRFPLDVGLVYCCPLLSDPLSTYNPQLLRSLAIQPAAMCHL